MEPLCFSMITVLRAQLEYACIRLADVINDMKFPTELLEIDYLYISCNFTMIKHDNQLKLQSTSSKSFTAHTVINDSQRVYFSRLLLERYIVRFTATGKNVYCFYRIGPEMDMLSYSFD